MSCSAHDFYQNMGSMMEKMKEKTPNAAGGFGALFSKVMTDGKISLKQKELVAVGIAVASKCEPCILAHVKKSLQAGATPEEILEAAEVAVMMGGGPAYMHLPAVIEALQANE